MRITLVVPRLLALPAEALVKDEPLARIAALAAPVLESDLDAALLDDLAVDAAPAPLAALGAGLEVGRDWVIRADPVTMVVGREDARLAGYVHDLDDVERAALLALLNGHFGSDGLAFASPRADAWFAMSVAPHAVDTASFERASGRALRSFLPAGHEKARWRRWFTEAQMLLHGHALAERRGPPVNALWFSGGGVLPDATRMPAVNALAAPGRNGDVLRGIARTRGETAPDARHLEDALKRAGREPIAVALAPVDVPGALDEASRNFFVPAIAALHRGAVASIRLIADGGRGAASWHARAPSWLQRFGRRRARFAAPAPSFFE